MNFRLASNFDIPRLVELGCEFLTTSRYKDSITPDPDAIAASMERMIEAEHCLIAVADVDGVVVGMIGVMATLHPFTGQGIMSELFWYMHPDHRGRGVSLLNIAERWARINGAKQAIMISPSKKVGNFLRRRGYERLEEQFIRTL
jgi:GNAT superfamily N-acetyltransferase